MVKCRPDITAHTIILSQYMDNPGHSHYVALKQIAKYLSHTIQDGIHYWRQSPNPNLPYHALPQLHSDNYIQQEQRGTQSKEMIGYVDSDWATKKQTSIMGMIIMFAGGAIGYKSKFQTVIAHSSTEAEL
jgi:hypothetical protein